jgi:hypothetical protein
LIRSPGKHGPNVTAFEESARRGFEAWNDPTTKGFERDGRPLGNVEMMDMHNFICRKVKEAVKKLNTEENRCPMCKARENFFVDFKVRRLMCLGCGNRFGEINFKEF